MQVFVAGLPCVVEAGSITSTRLSCRTPAVAGKVLAEFWQMPSGTNSLPPDLESYTQPGMMMVQLLLARGDLD